MTEYKWLPGMREISGFGGGYEDACREMLFRGVKWIYDNPNADIRFRGCKNVYGILTEDTDDAKTLSDIITQGTDCTGAMHYAVVNHLLYIQSHGWDAYTKEMMK